MQEHWHTFTTAFESALKQKDALKLYPLFRLLHYSAQQFLLNEHLNREALRHHFTGCLPAIVEQLTELSIMANEERIRIELSNFLCQFCQHWEINVLSQTLRLGDGYQYDLKMPFDHPDLYQPTSEDIGYLFGDGTGTVKGYRYSEEIDDALKGSKTDYTDVERISGLIRFALPVFNRRLYLLTQDNTHVCDDETLKTVTQHIGLLVQWRLGQLKETPLSSLELKPIVRFYQVCYVYQQKIVKPFTPSTLEEDLAKALKTIQTNYADPILQLQRYAVLVERLHKDFPKHVVFNDALFQAIHVAVNTPVNPIDLPINYRCCKERFRAERNAWENKLQPVFKQQQDSSAHLKCYLQGVVDNSIALLGPPPCDIGLLLLGSSARGDRLPYSDIELALLYEPFHVNKKQETAHYIVAFIALIELQIVHLGESSVQYQGVWLDSSTSFRSHNHLRGSVEDVFQKGIINKQTDMQLDSPDNLLHLTLHSFLYDPSAYSKKNTSHTHGVTFYEKHWHGWFNCEPNCISKQKNKMTV